MAVIELIKKDKTPILEHTEMWGGNFYARKWKLDKGGIFKCEVSYHIDDIDEATKKPKINDKTGKVKKKYITKILEFLIEEELVFLNIDGERVFPISEEEENATFESEFN